MFIPTIPTIKYGHFRKDHSLVILVFLNMTPQSLCLHTEGSLNGRCF